MTTLFVMLKHDYEDVHVVGAFPSERLAQIKADELQATHAQEHNIEYWEEHVKREGSELSFFFRPGLDFTIVAVEIVMDIQTLDSPYRASAQEDKLTHVFEGSGWREVDV